MDDAGELRLFHQGLGLHLIAVRIQPVVPGCLEDVYGVGAVSGDAAVHPHLFQRDPLAVIGQDHGQAGCPALQRLHLHDDRHFGNALFDRFVDLFVDLRFVCTHYESLCRIVLNAL